MTLICHGCGLKVGGLSKATCECCNLELHSSLSDMEISDRAKNFSIEQLRECYVLQDTYWDDGLDDAATLQKIKQVLGVFG